MSDSAFKRFDRDEDTDASVSQPFVPLSKINADGTNSLTAFLRVSPKRTREIARIALIVTTLWRIIVLFAFTQAFILDGSTIGPGWQRSDFFWAIIVSAVGELVRAWVMPPLAKNDPAARDALIQWRNAQVILHVAAFVAFMRLEAANKSRPEGNCACLLVVMIDAIQMPLLQRLVA